MQTFQIKNTVARDVTFYGRRDPAVPRELFSTKREAPDLSAVNVPLPARKKDYACFIDTGKALWLGAPNGVTRYEAAAERDADRVMYFSAQRDLPDNDVKALYCDGEDPESVWVLTAKGASHIVLSYISAEEKADRLTEETLRYVDRHGMVTQRTLSVPRELSSRVPYGHSDNSGTFTAGFAVGELCKYAVLKRERGADDPKTQAAKAGAVRAVEATLLLMYIAGRGDGFVARTYVTSAEPVPDDGLFYRKSGGRATCLPTSEAKEKGLAGKVIDACAPVPERLSKLYRDEGFTDDDITYKGDTSSDEITHHYWMIYFAHEILGEEDPELDELMKAAAKATMAHILDHGCELHECNGKPTTWAKWSRPYFRSPVGWSDGCLNAAEILMYLKVVMHITGETGRWKEAYDALVADGYAKLTSLHDARFHMSAQTMGLEQVEELMYGDNMLATCSYWLLIALEDDPALKELYRQGYKGWDGTFRREHNPIYDFPYMLSCPDQTVDTERLIDWFRRFHATRLSSPASVTQRSDVPLRARRGGMRETGWLLPPDEHYITKYDRNPYYWEGDGSARLVESCYPYTCAYWLGRYYGIIERERKENV